MFKHTITISKSDATIITNLNYYLNKSSKMTLSDLHDDVYMKDPLNKNYTFDAWLQMPHVSNQPKFHAGNVILYKLDPMYIDYKIFKIVEVNFDNGTYEVRAFDDFSTYDFTDITYTIPWRDDVIYSGKRFNKFDLSESEFVNLNA